MYTSVAKYTLPELFQAQHTLPYISGKVPFALLVKYTLPIANWAKCYG